MEPSGTRFFYSLLIVVMALLTLAIFLLSATIFHSPFAAGILYAGLDVLAILIFLAFRAAANQIKHELSEKPLSGSVGAEQPSDQPSIRTQQGISFSKSLRYWSVATATGFLLIVTGFCLIELHVDQITPENCDRIRIGMTMAEVETILGASPGNCSKRFWKSQWPGGLTIGSKRGEPQEGPKYFWMGDKGTVVVVFDQNESVRQKNFREAPAESYSNDILRILQWIVKSNTEL